MPANALPVARAACTGAMRRGRLASAGGGDGEDDDDDEGSGGGGGKATIGTFAAGTLTGERGGDAAGTTGAGDLRFRLEALNDFLLAFANQSLCTPGVEAAAGTLKRFPPRALLGPATSLRRL